MKKSSGFTLIELTIALALAILLLGLVVIRVSYGGDRQQTVNAARRLGNLFESCREKAQAGECLYAFQFDGESGACKVFQTPERNAALLQSLQPVKCFELPPLLKFSRITLQNRELPKPAVIFLDDKGLLADLRIEIRSGQGAIVQLSPDPLINAIRYEER